MPTFIRALLGCALLASLAAPALAHTPLGGLTVACSPDGKTLAVGGDNRTLYVLDAATLAVQRRVWLSTTIWRMAFNKDGSKLLVEDTRSALRLVDTRSWTHREVKGRAAFLSPARAVNLCAAYDEYHRAPTGPQPTIKLLSMTDGAVVHTLPLGAGNRVSCFGLSPDGTRVAVLFAPKKDAEEPAVPYGKIPKDLKGLAREAFRKKNDGYTAQFRVYEVAGGKVLADGKLFYSVNRGEVVFSGDDVLIVTYDNVNARIGSDLRVELFAQGNSLNYGIGVAPDHKTLLTGGLRVGTRAVVGETLESATFTIDALPGWPEYFKGFAVASDGTAYATTSAFRVARIGPDGKVQAIKPVN